MVKLFCNGAESVDAFLMSGARCPLIVKGVKSYEYNGSPNIITSYIFSIVIHR